MAILDIISEDAGETATTETERSVTDTTVDTTIYVPDTPETTSQTEIDKTKISVTVLVVIEPGVISKKDTSEDTGEDTT